LDWFEKRKNPNGSAIQRNQIDPRNPINQTNPTSHARRGQLARALSCKGMASPYDACCPCSYKEGLMTVLSTGWYGVRRDSAANTIRARENAAKKIMVLSMMVSVTVNIALAY
jgi:hypothetical protein